MRELHEKGYIIYEPSYNPFRGSMVHMIQLSSELKPLSKKEQTQLKNKQAIEQALNKKQTSIRTSNEQALVSSINIINNTNSINNVNIEEQAKNKKNNQFKNNIPSCHPELVEGNYLENSIPPELSNVVTFFYEKKASEIDAEKFYNHFQSNGWLVGGKSKMKDWKAAASNWMINSEKFKKKRYSELVEAPKPNHLNATQNKNYSEPL
jgi:hypothetical protein